VFAVTETSDGFQISFSATLENVDRVADATKRFLSRVDAGAHTFGMILALREGLTNAVVEGSHLNADKTVFCSLLLDGDSLVVEIEDGGDGFDWRGCLPEVPSAHFESGRGLAIMKRYCETVAYNDKGNKLILKRRIR
jgi:anti-sigma regulatory factor (Ser/Thr protein kinase)